MYHHFYHMKHDPFADAPDPAFLFLAPSHTTALQTILHGIQQRLGLLALFGATGLGKTLLLHTLLEGIHGQQRLKPVRIFYPKISCQDLFDILYGELGLQRTTADTAERLSQLKQALLTAYEQGWNVVLVVDDIQDMSEATLNSLLHLSDFKTSSGVHLVQIVLAGLPNAWRMFNLPQFRPFKTCLARRVTLVPLTPKESLAYIRHRLAQLLVPTDTLFMRGALKPLIRAAHGNPRVLNTLCSNALITGVLCQQKPISPALVQEVIAECGEKPARPYRRWRSVTAAGVLLGAGLWWGGQTYWGREARKDVVEHAHTAPLEISSPLPYAASLSPYDSIESEPGEGVSLPQPEEPFVPQQAAPVHAETVPRKTAREKAPPAPSRPTLKAGHEAWKKTARQPSPPGPGAAPTMLTIQIHSFPEGARVTIGRKVVGTTPLTMQLVTGVHTVTLEKSGYSRLRDDIRLHTHTSKELYYNLLMEGGSS
jgi:general secretion pathway protein A